MGKTYSDFMNEITPNELYDRLIQHGLFSEKLPPIFDASSFLSYCKDTSRPVFSDKPYHYVTYDSMRNINIPRTIGVPVPMGYERLCATLKDNWPRLQSYFATTTTKQKYIVSRIHIRKMRDIDALFEMNYNNWKIDGTPEPDLLIGKRYMVCADISSCFPSIYTHVLPWALVGKSTAKSNRNPSNWYNQIDHWAQVTKNGETHGILIGPHTSNILSEIVLCKIDEILCPKWDYIRNIDDYCCYVKTQEQADEFLVDLNCALRNYGLLLNHKKTQVVELPVGAVERWVRQIECKSNCFEKFQPYVDYKEVRMFMDFCIELMAKNKDNASIIYYALKILHNHNLTYNAQINLTKTVISLSLLYPYIIPLLDRYLFIPYPVDSQMIKQYLDLLYEQYSAKNYHEACSYVLYYAAKYNIVINAFDIDEIIEKNDCILLLTALIYCRKKNDSSGLKKLKDHAKQLKANDELEEYWPFAYECLTVGFLADNWKKMKQANISFLKAEYQ